MTVREAMVIAIPKKLQKIIMESHFNFLLILLMEKISVPKDIIDL